MALYPAIATASAAIAESPAFADGENLRLETMLEVLRRISKSVNVPVTADIEAGADCIYPIGPGDRETLSLLRERIKAPLNVLASPKALGLADLHKLGINRVCFGPQIFRSCLAKLIGIVDECQSRSQIVEDLHSALGQIKQITEDLTEEEYYNTRVLSKQHLELRKESL